ncbi:hypothetical protein P0D89_37645 [Paraburkholderia sp. RL18-085-BIA-A]
MRHHRQRRSDHGLDALAECLRIVCDAGHRKQQDVITRERNVLRTDDPRGHHRVQHEQRYAGENDIRVVTATGDQPASKQRHQDEIEDDDRFEGNADAGQGVHRLGQHGKPGHPVAEKQVRVAECGISAERPVPAVGFVEPEGRSRVRIVAVCEHAAVDERDRSHAGVEAKTEQTEH